MHRLLVVFIYLVLVLSTLLVFWQTRNFDFINYDDYDYVVQNPHVINGLNWTDIAKAFTAPHFGNFLPLTWLSFMLDCQLFGPNPGRIHLVNVFLHIANALLLFTVLRKMTNSLWPSVFVAAAFAVHPMHVESVAWVTERKDVLSTLFLLLTLTAYGSYVRAPNLLRYLLTILFYVLGLLAKPMLVTVPLLLLLLDYWPLDRFGHQSAKNASRKSRKSDIPAASSVFSKMLIEKIPFFALAIVSATITFIVQRDVGTVAAISTVSLGDRLANSIVSCIRYIARLLWPQNLAIFYPFDIDTFAFWQIALCALLVFILTVAAIYFGRKRKFLLVGWLWFIISLLPVIGIIQSGPQGWADRYTYIPYMGLFIIAAWGFPQILPRFPNRSFVLVAAAIITLAALGISAYVQTTYWKDTTTLFTHALAVTKNNYLAHYNFASDLAKKGQTAQAVEHYNKAIQIKPYYTDAILGLGDVYAGKGEVDRAIELFQKTLSLNPNADAAAHAHNNLGIMYQEKGNLDKALSHLRKAVQLRPGSPIPANALAWFLATCHELKNPDPNEAIRLARTACQLTDYKNPSYLDTLAAAYASAGRFSEATETAKTALKIAETANQPYIKETLMYHLSFYSQDRPYIESIEKSLPDSNKP